MRWRMLGVSVWLLGALVAATVVILAEALELGLATVCGAGCLHQPRGGFALKLALPAVAGVGFVGLTLLASARARDKTFDRAAAAATVALVAWVVLTLAFGWVSFGAGD